MAKNKSLVDDICILEYNDTKKRLAELSCIRIYDDKRIEEIQTKLIHIENKIGKVIQMLMAHDYACERRNKK